MDIMPVLKALADGTRMKILTLLLRRRCCVRALARELNLSQAAVSQHLKVLRQAGLLQGERRGYFMHYRVNRDVLEQLARELQHLAGLQPEEAPPGAGCPGRGGACRCSKNRRE